MPAVLARVIEGAPARAQAIGLLRLNLKSSPGKAYDLGRKVMEQAPLGIAYCHRCTDLNVGTKPSLYLLG